MPGFPIARRSLGDLITKWLVIDCREGIKACYFMGWLRQGGVSSRGSQETMWTSCGEDIHGFDSYEEAVIERGLIMNLDPMSPVRQLGVQSFRERA